MSDSSSYTEFKLSVTVYSLESADEQPCGELTEICRLVEVASLSVSPAEMYPRSKPLILKSKGDEETFLSIDLQADPTDQMSMASVFVRCKDSVADAVHEQLKRIRERSEVTTALLRGNLGLAPASTNAHNPYESPDSASRPAPSGSPRKPVPWALLPTTLLAVFCGIIVLAGLAGMMSVVYILPAVLETPEGPSNRRSVGIDIIGMTVAGWFVGTTFLLSARYFWSRHWTRATIYLALGIVGWLLSSVVAYFVA